MTLGTRLSRLFKADMHGLLDRLEEPDVVIRQAVRDMEADVAAREALLAAARQELMLDGQRLARLQRDRTELDAQLAMCLGSGKDDLARGVLRKRLEGDQLIQAVTARQAATAAAIDAASRELDECRDKLAGIKQKADVFGCRTAGAERDRDSPHLPVTDDDVEIALLRAKQQLGGPS